MSTSLELREVKFEFYAGPGSSGPSFTLMVDGDGYVCLNKNMAHMISSMFLMAVRDGCNCSLRLLTETKKGVHRCP